MPRKIQIFLGKEHFNENSFAASQICLAQRVTPGGWRWFVGGGNLWGGGGKGGGVKA